MKLPTSRSVSEENKLLKSEFRFNTSLVETPERSGRVGIGRPESPVTWEQESLKSSPTDAEGKRQADRCSWGGQGDLRHIQN